MNSRIVGTLAVALTSLGVFAGTAGASASSSTNSIYNSGGLGTCQAASVAAGHQANSAAVRYYPYTTYYGYNGYCGGQGG